jgi:PRTRC genetic system protein A
VNVIYDRRDASFHLVWPEHAASRGSVEYDPLPETDDLILFAEIHSHHGMPAFFSRDDGESEKRSGLYGVVGRINRPRPEARFRYSCGGELRPIRAARIFDDAEVVNALVEQP